MLGSTFMENNDVHDDIIMIRYFYYIFACSVQWYIFTVFPSDFRD